MIETIFNDTSNIESLTFMVEQMYAQMFEKELNEILKPTESNSQRTSTSLKSTEGIEDIGAAVIETSDDGVAVAEKERREEGGAISGLRDTVTALSKRVDGLYNRFDTIESLLEKVVVEIRNGKGALSDEKRNGGDVSTYHDKK